MIGENFAGKDLVLEILNKAPTSITDAEKQILLARSSYLTEEERERYGIGEPTPKPEPKAKAKKGK